MYKDVKWIIVAMNGQIVEWNIGSQEEAYQIADKYAKAYPDDAFRVTLQTW